MDPYIPFCGTPPLPGELWTRWTLDPALIAGLGLFGAVGLGLARDRWKFLLGWGLVTVLFVSPLCAASMALFSARVGQHLLLTLLAAPLLATALPVLRLPALPLAAAFAAAFWGWHLPGPYAATLQSDLAYWAMHLSLFGLSAALFSAIAAAPERALPAAALTGAQMTLFATVVTLAPAPWHMWHMATTGPFGLSALADQQLAGGLMWVGGGALFLASMGVFAARFLGGRSSAPRTTLSRDPPFGPAPSGRAPVPGPGVVPEAPADGNAAHPARRDRAAPPLSVRHLPEPISLPHVGNAGRSAPVHEK